MRHHCSNLRFDSQTCQQLRHPLTEEPCLYTERRREITVSRNRFSSSSNRNSSTRGFRRAIKRSRPCNRRWKQTHKPSLETRPLSCRPTFRSSKTHMTEIGCANTAVMSIRSIGMHTIDGRRRIGRRLQEISLIITWPFVACITGNSNNNKCKTTISSHLHSMPMEHRLHLRISTTRLPTMPECRQQLLLQCRQGHLPCLHIPVIPTNCHLHRVTHHNGSTIHTTHSSSNNNNIVPNHRKEP